MISRRPLATAALATAENQVAGMESILSHSRAVRSGQPTSSENATTVSHRRIRGAKNGLSIFHR